MPARVLAAATVLCLPTASWAYSQVVPLTARSVSSRNLVAGNTDSPRRAPLSSRPPATVLYMSDPVSYLSNIEAAGAAKKVREGEEAPSDPRERVGQTEQVNGAPANYEGFVDGEGFDGGDGQVGVVGDGTNAMETFDQSESVQRRRQNAVGGAESKDTRANVWGFTTGYADELKKKGMVEYDEYGEDRLKARRQQLENYRNQRELRLQKEGQMRDLYAMQGKQYEAQRHGSYLSGLEGPPKTVDAPPSQQLVLDAGDTVHGALAMSAPLNGRGGTSLAVQNEYSTYADFVAGFAPGSDPAFTVEPTVGTLNRRGSAPQEFVIKFQPTVVGQARATARLVVETEDYKWTYDCVGDVY